MTDNRRPPPTDIVVIVSADAEWRAVLEIVNGVNPHQSQLGEWFPWEPAGQPGLPSVVFFHGGWGKISAAASTQFVIDHFQPSLLVNLGTCGGIEGAIERGTIVLAPLGNPLDGRAIRA